MVTLGFLMFGSIDIEDANINRSSYADLVQSQRRKEIDIGMM